MTLPTVSRTALKLAWPSLTRTAALEIFASASDRRGGHASVVLSMFYSLTPSQIAAPNDAQSNDFYPSRLLPSFS